MDTTETYIKMCEKAEEIQASWNPTGGDWYIHDYRGTTKTSLEFERQIWGASDNTWRDIEILCYRPSESKDVVISTDGKESRCVAVADLVKEHSIWLPRQDQLQEMLKAKNLTELIGAVYKWLKDNNYDQYYDDVTSNPYSSMEQIWLAFVMKERYGKIWADGDWVK